MADDLISGNTLLRAAERVRAKRAAEQAGGVAAPITITQVKSTSAQVRARLNFIPNSDTLSSMIDNALGALSRGVRWARGSIVNLLV
ncbi:MAG: hypothetical protein V4735_07265 [Pseudomonadota bacterium]